MSLLGGGVAGLALEQAIPFNRVWSFPKEIVVASPYSRAYLKALLEYHRRFQDGEFAPTHFITVDRFVFRRIEILPRGNFRTEARLCDFTPSLPEAPQPAASTSSLP